ncbi:hypothetical protein BK133_13935 [Paenibacillus sp. FSL H8-0548]|uniref:glycosyltransferase n=1 Tax=Paenibacillus sp. FSL H8-0548 TaxID=1920422 RepID=UPI00096E7AD5|nr:glycosyltransferase [Paenibacillus sp. FSL H8-0548]OMF32604.1 hypothetical protein BK133_13935 [Paenibacillus sp. FSL H8-0548]
MKILILNDYLVYGGAEVQTLREKQILEHNGNEVYLMTFDENFPEDDVLYNIGNHYINIPINYSSIRRNYHRFGLFNIKLDLLSKIQENIERISPDIIHINNINKEPFTIYEAIKGYNVVQTLRDYSAVCPKGTCIKPDGSICEGSAYNNCKTVCADNIVKKLRFTLWGRINKKRKVSIGNYISPSLKLTEICRRNGYHIRCINNSFDFKKYEQYEKNTDFENKKYLFYGAINSKKGVLELIDAFQIFQKDKKVELLIAGKLFEDIEDTFRKKIEGCKKIRYLGVLDYSEMINTLESVHTIVVPSVWMENYPNTVLEGLSMRILVIGSNRGGIPEMLDNGRGFTFDVYKIEGIINALKKSYNLSEDEYNLIVEANRDYTIKNNSLDQYSTRLMMCFNEIVERDSRIN